jgi:hypothetical protein
MPEQSDFHPSALSSTGHSLDTGHPFGVPDSLAADKSVPLLPPWAIPSAEVSGQATRDPSALIITNSPS